jgi:FtsP/CotA-like multicopper oxidase with cupredoxin domain
MEVGYRWGTINGHCLGHGEPVRVREGQRVLFHFLNASATENLRLALPGHRFEVVALDGNRVPCPEMVRVLELGTAERIDAVVTMDNPGVWILGSTSDAVRGKGMGIVVEYANRGGEARWIQPEKDTWDYTLFGERRRVPKPDQVIPMVFRQEKAGADGVEQWSISGKYDGGSKVKLSRGARYRLVFDNRSEDPHPVHLHRERFELTNVDGKATSGIVKDVVMVNPYRKIAADFTPSIDGPMLFHCHQQIHMEHGFKMLFDVS